MSMVVQLRRADEATLEALSKTANAAIDYLTDEAAYDGDTIVDTDKAWHAIHFLLTGSADGDDLPAGFLMAGQEVGEDAGYGPARILTAAEIADIAAHLAGLPDDLIEANFDFDALEAADIYPSIWDRKDPEDIEYVQDYFEELKAFIATAAAAEEGCVLAML